jgi:signal transduction histidine kinase
LAAGVAHEINNPIGYVSSNLNTLQKYLDLEWCYAETSVVDDIRPAALPHKNLPYAVRQDLLRLARLGHVRGLQTALDGIARADPSLRPVCEQLSELVIRFDLDSLQSQLMEPHHAT